MELTATVELLIATTAISGLGAGATLDQAIKQLPARHRIGAERYADYVKAADLANGEVWYPVLGISTSLVTAVAVIAGLLADPDTPTAIGLYAIGAGLVLQLAASVRAAPTLVSLKKGGDPSATLDRFALWNAMRAAAVSVTLAASCVTLALALRG